MQSLRETTSDAVFEGSLTRGCLRLTRSIPLFCPLDGGVTSQSHLQVQSINPSPPLKVRRSSTAQHPPLRLINNETTTMTPIHDSRNQQPTIQEAATRSLRRKKRQYLCQSDGCGKPLTRPQDVRRHEKEYHGNVRYACPSCSSTNKRKYKMKTHIKHSHREIGMHGPSSSLSKLRLTDCS